MQLTARNIGIIAAGVIGTVVLLSAVGGAVVFSVDRYGIFMNIRKIQNGEKPPTGGQWQ